MDTYTSHQSTSDLPTPRTPSPSLVVAQDRSRKSSLTRRRSWGNNKLKEAARAESSSVHPLHLDLDANMSTRRGGGNDPFLLSNHERPIPQPQYSDDLYSDPHMIGTSSRASLMHGHFKHELEDDGHREDDEAHLTSNMSRTGTDTLLLEDDSADTGPKTPDYNLDPEIDGGTTPRTRRRTIRYSLTPSPLKQTETAIKSVSKTLKKMSLRVVNLANTELEGHLRLGDGNKDGGNKGLGSEDEEDEGPPPPELKKVFPIRGRALGFLGPESKIRLALFNFLVHPCVLLFYSPQVFD
jgi:voltage-dependent calcium channel